jgi:hypothetical protein
LPVTIRLSTRIAGLAVVAAEATAVATRADESSAQLFGVVLVALQTIAVVWATDRRSAVVLRMVAPALLTAVTVAAVWTSLALAVPMVATGDTAALLAILVIAPAAAAPSRRTHGRRWLSIVLLASAASALLIFLVISCVLPMIPGFVTNNHPPTYTSVTRVVDPVREGGIFVLLAVALGVDLVGARIRMRRAAARELPRGHTAGPNEMVVERAV